MDGNRSKIENSPLPVQGKKFMIHLWKKLTDPHPDIQERAQRRLAALLSAVILGFIVVGIVLEVFAIALISWQEGYTGYRQTIISVLMLGVAYVVSRTRHYRTAAFLLVVISTWGVFASAWAEPKGAEGGLLDFLIIPVLVASMYFSLPTLGGIFTLLILGLFLFPVFVPEISYDMIVIGPASFLFALGLTLFLMIRTRNQLEQDRLADLIASEHRARQRLDQLQALRTIDVAITSGHDLQKTLDILLDQLISCVKMDVAVILLLNKTDKVLEYAAGKGLRTQALRYTKLRVGQGIAGVAARERTIVHVADLRKSHFLFTQAPLLKEEGVISYLAVPLISNDKIKGVIEIFYRSPFEPDDEEKAFLESLGRQAAIAIDNATLFDNLQNINADLLKAYDSTIEGWSRALDLRDKETVGHTLRVTEMTLRLANVLGISEQETTYIRWGALLHDIGKMGVPDTILHKPGPLTEEEWEIMKRHPVYAREMLLHIEYLRPALDIPYCHHEKWDGTGYPRGLKGEEIPLAARIFAVIDVWDALSSDRPYRRAWPAARVFEHIRSQANTHFDPNIVEVFLKLWAESTENL